MPRCFWCTDDPLYQAYHDQEWGTPQRDPALLFEMLLLEGFQAGLSWITVLKKRERYREVLHGFDPVKLSQMSDERIEELMLDAGIIRNRRKIEAAIHNARMFLAIRKEFGSFDNYIWGFVNFKPVLHSFKTQSEVPVTTELSDRISKDLSKRGFKFVGSTIVYAYMQGIGMVDDHDRACLCRRRR